MKLSQRILLRLHKVKSMVKIWLVFAIIIVGCHSPAYKIATSAVDADTLMHVVPTTARPLLYKKNNTIYIHSATGIKYKKSFFLLKIKAAKLMYIISNKDSQMRVMQNSYDSLLSTNSIYIGKLEYDISVLTDTLKSRSKW